MRHMYNGRQYEMKQKEGDLGYVTPTGGAISWPVVAERSHGSSSYTLAQQEPERVATSTN